MIKTATVHSTIIPVDVSNHAPRVKGYCPPYQGGAPLHDRKKALVSHIEQMTQL